MRALAALISITEQIAEDVREAIDEIVDAFQAFVQWAIDIIESTIGTLFSPIVNAVQDSIDDYCNGVLAACTAMQADIGGTGSPSARQHASASAWSSSF